MTTASRVPPHDRFFARLEKFQCACPSCGDLLRLRGMTHYKGDVTKDKRPFSQLVWNPLTQRLRCPRCHGAFVAGLLLYPLRPGGAGVIDPPPDTVRTRQERQEARRVAGGWCPDQPYRNGTAVNLHVTEGCSCPLRGWAKDCAVHGQPLPLVSPAPQGP